MTLPSKSNGVVDTFNALYHFYYWSNRYGMSRERKEIMYPESFGGSDFILDPSLSSNGVIDTFNILYLLYYWSKRFGFRFNL